MLYFWGDAKTTRAKILQESGVKCQQLNFRDYIYASTIKFSSLFTYGVEKNRNTSMESHTFMEMPVRVLF